MCPHDILLKLPTFKGLSELPTRWCRVVAGDGPAIACGDLEREALAIEVGVALPVLAPVPGHGLPPCPRPFDGHRVHVSCPTHVRDQDQIEVRVAVDCKPYAPFLCTGYPAKINNI